MGGVQVEAGAANQVMPFGQGAAVLGQVVGARGDQAVGAAGDRAGAAGVGDEEDGGVAVDIRFGGDRLANEGLFLLEARDELAAVELLKGSVCHD